MNHRSSKKIYPGNEFDDLEVSFELRSKGGIESFVSNLFHWQSPRNVIAIITLVVMGLGFCYQSDIWGLLATDFLILCFSSFVIYFGESGGPKQNKTPSCSNELGDES